MIYKKTIQVPQKVLDMVHRYLTEEPKSKEDCFGEDEAICCTAEFGNGVAMDVKCCGVQYEEGGSNTAWTEAVLFRNGSQIAHTEVCDTFEGEWELEEGDDVYCVNIVPED